MSEGSPIVLTEELALTKSKNCNIEEIKGLALWGMYIENIDIIKRMKSLETASLSTNYIKTLEPFSHCPNLRELYVRRNHLSSLAEIDHLKGLKELHILWLSDNPIASEEGYRSYVIRTLPQITRLDDKDVTPDEREHVVIEEAIRTLLPILTDSQKAKIKERVESLLY